MGNKFLPMLLPPFACRGSHYLGVFRILIGGDVERPIMMSNRVPNTVLARGKKLELTHRIISRQEITLPRLDTADRHNQECVIFRFTNVNTIECVIFLEEHGCIGRILA